MLLELDVEVRHSVSAEINTGINADVDTTTDNPITPETVLLGKEGWANKRKITGLIADAEKVINPTTNEQVVTTGILERITKVTVPAVTSSIDENIIPSNIKKDVNILGVIGTYGEDKPTQYKTVNPNREIQEIVPDEGYELAKVTVTPIPNDYYQIEIEDETMILLDGGEIEGEEIIL